MSLLEHPTAQALLEDAKVTPQMVVGCRDRLTAFLERYLPRFYRIEQEELARLVIEGKLSSLERKTCEPIANEAGHHRKPVQHFVGAGQWDDDAVLGELWQQVADEVGDDAAVLTLDPSAFPKKGTASCGVARQWCGRLGKLDNCQVGVFLGYVTEGTHVLVDHRLYLPEDWADDDERRELTHVPEDVVFQEKWRIALDLLDRSGRVLPHGWVTGDDELGRPSEFRAELRFRRERYVLDVPCNTLVRPLHPRSKEFVRADAWAASQPASAWQEMPWRRGEKGPVRVQVLSQPVQTQEEAHPGPRERLLVIRTLDAQPKTWYCLSNAHAVETSQLVAVRAKHHRIEQLLHDGKSEAGLGHYEVRSWVGWHHHMTLTLLALWFLAREKRRVEKKRRR
jgi:SRSO17 transposase